MVLLCRFINKITSYILSNSAESFKNNTYQEVLELFKERGELSDDNDKWIDKHSGYIIKFIEFDDSEGYDESGYKIVSRDYD